MAKNKKDGSEGAKEGTAGLGTPGPDIPDNAASVDRMPVTIHAQYVRDLSFENPNAPLPLRRAEAEGDSGIDVDFSLDACKIDDLPDIEDGYEVIMRVTVKASKGKMATFIAEIEYGMMLSVHDVPQDKLHPLLFIEMPNYMFPFVRQILSELTQQANYMPFMLAPVNFKALYRRRFGGPKVNVIKSSGDATPAKAESA